MHAITELPAAPRRAPARFHRVETGPDFGAIADQLAVLLAKEHRLRRRAESAADGLTVTVTHLLQEMDQLRTQRARAEGIAKEMSVILAHERAERERAEQEAEEARTHADSLAIWRSRLRNADRRERRRLLSKP